MPKIPGSASKAKATTAAAVKPARTAKKGKKEAFSLYIHRVLKQAHPDLGVSKKTMSVLNSFIYDIFEKIATSAGELARVNGKRTLSSRDVQTAVRLLLPGELAKHAVTEGTKAVTKYTTSDKA